jgi:signal peptidase II
MQSPEKRFLFFLVALFIFILDQFTKYLIQVKVSPSDIIEVLPFFNIVYVKNPGAAFGMFQELGATFLIIVAAIAIIFVSVLIIKDPDNRLAYSFLLGGAAGNMTDRIIHGFVIDFLDFYIYRYHWPAFNVADMALTAGVFLLLIKMFLMSSSVKNKKKQKSNPSP